MGREFDIRKEIELPATPEEVWRAIATREGLAAWFGEPGIVPAEASAAVWEAPHRLVIRLPAGPDGATHAFEYEIEARAGGRAVLRFVHSGFLGDSWDADFDFGEVTGHGWDMYLHTLAEYLTHFPGRRAVYVQAEAPPASAGEGAWPVLAAALGVDTGVRVGDRVRLAVDGGVPADGIADYVATGHFLGVRLDDALVRFHLRGVIGLPVAVGLHLYGSGVDAARTRAAWQSWLTDAFA